MTGAKPQEDAMRSRAGPRGGFALLAILIVALMTTGCASTREKLGAVFSGAGQLVTDTGGILTGIGDVIVNGPAEDIKAASDTVGITTPTAPPAKIKAPVPAPAPAAPPAEPEGRRGPIPSPDERLPLEHERGPTAYLEPPGHHCRSATSCACRAPGFRRRV